MGCGGGGVTNIWRKCDIIATNGSVNLLDLAAPTGSVRRHMYVNTSKTTHRL